MELNTVDGPVVVAAAAVQTGIRCRADASGGSVPQPGGVGGRRILAMRNGAEYVAADVLPVADPDGAPHRRRQHRSYPAATVRSIYQYQSIGRGLGRHRPPPTDRRGRPGYEGRHLGSDASPMYGPNSGRRTGGRCMSRRRAREGLQRGQHRRVPARELLSSQPLRPGGGWLPSLTKVLAALVAVSAGSIPLATTAYLSPVNGNTHTGATIAGHRNWAATECPGAQFYPMLASIRTGVAARLTRRGPYVPPLDPTPLQTRGTGRASGPGLTASRGVCAALSAAR